MLDIAQNLTVDRLAADIPGERTAVVSEGGTLLLFGVCRRRESHRRSAARQRALSATSASQ